MDMLISSVLPPVAWMGVRRGDSVEKKPVAWDPFLMCSLADGAYGGSLQVTRTALRCQISEEQRSWKDGLIWSYLGRVMGRKVDLHT